MTSVPEADRKWTQRPSVGGGVLADTDSMFQLLFERSADAICLLDPQTGVLVDCNAATVALMRANSKEELRQVSPADLAPKLQPDGKSSRAMTAEIIGLVQRNGSHRFEWTARRLDGTEVPLEVLATAVDVGDRVLHVAVSRDVTERKKAEEQVRQLNQTLEQRVMAATADLRAREAQFRTLVEQAPEAIVVFDGVTGRFEMVNENAVRLFGRSREELLRLTPTDVSPSHQPDGRPSAEVAREKIDAALAGEVPVFEWLHRDANGRLFTSEVRLVHLPGERCCLVRASIIDDTEHKRAEQVQRATYEISEAVHAVEDLASLYKRIHSIVKTLMPAENFYIALHDPATQQHYYAYHVDQVDARPAPRKMDTGLNGYVLRTGRALLADRASMISADNEWHLISGTPSAIWLGVPLDVRGRTLGLMAVQHYQDERAYGEKEKQILTFVAAQIALAIERKRTEETVRQRHREVTALLESLPGYAFFKDTEGRYVMANQNFAQAVGKTSQSILGRTDEDLFPRELAKKYRADDARLLETGELLVVGEEQMIDGGRLFIVQTTKVPVKNDRGEVVGLIGLGFDVTERKNAEAELLKALAREKELGQLKSNFVSMVSHEFRTPLGIIMSSAEILQDYFQKLSEEERNAQLESIQKNTRRMADLMEEVLLLSRFEAGKMDFQPKPIDLRVFCLRLVEEVLSAAECRSPVEVDCTSLPAEAEADERLLRHIFLNLLTNALKYSECGQAVRFTMHADGRDAVCRIVDRGIGIPEADREWLFNAFHRGRNVGQRPGTGLGLVIVKRCVALHGGRVQIESKVGEGTTATVRLPVFPPNGNDNGNHRSVP